jgi:ElaB/YqjD/DUF883 family membrane-anchored ribosome-binding protein
MNACGSFNGMSEFDHTFPMPETAAQKLDRISAELSSQPALKKAQDWVRANPWPAVAVATGTGLLFGVLLGNCR